MTKISSVKVIKVTGNGENIRMEKVVHHEDRRLKSNAAIIVNDLVEQFESIPSNNIAYADTFLAVFGPTQCSEVCQKFVLCSKFGYSGLIKKLLEKNQCLRIAIKEAYFRLRECKVMTLDSLKIGQSLHSDDLKCWKETAQLLYNLAIMNFSAAPKYIIMEIEWMFAASILENCLIANNLCMLSNGEGDGYCKGCKMWIVPGNLPQSSVHQVICTDLYYHVSTSIVKAVKTLHVKNLKYNLRRMKKTEEQKTK